MTGKRILITGGAGYLGRYFVRQFYQNNDITVFSRDEYKHWKLKQEFPNVRCYLGDVRNLSLFRKVATGCQVGLFCASLKHLNQINENVDEAVQINIIGSRNSRVVAEECKFESACLVSTDKSRLPISIYGASKFIGGEAFIWGSERGRIEPRLSTLVCGNIINSDGSVLPAIWNAIASKREMHLYAEDMTRFLIRGEEVAEMMPSALSWNGYNVMPIMPSFRVKDAFDIYKERFGLRYSVVKPVGWVERTHEILVSDEEAPRTADCGLFFVSHYNHNLDDPLKKGVTSADVVMDKSALEAYLSKFNFFKPNENNL